MDLNSKLLAFNLIFTYHHHPLAVNTLMTQDAALSAHLQLFLTKELSESESITLGENGTACKL